MTAASHNPADRHRGPHRARLRFEQLPAAYCHPDHLSALLPDGLPASFRNRLQTSVRLRHRLSTLLACRFALPPLHVDDVDTPEGRFAQLEGSDLNGAIQQVGAIWHAKSIRRIILAEPLRALIAELGRETYRTALQFIELSPIESGDLDETPNVETLLSCIDRDGLHAVNVWCRDQPGAIAGRLKLKLPPCPEADEFLPTSHQDQCLVIVDRVVVALAAKADEGVSSDG